MEITVTVCDRCADPTRPTTGYTVTASDGRSGTVDLCDEHGAELEAIVGPPRSAAPKKAAPRAASKTAKAGRKPPGGRRIKVVSMDEVAAAKQND